MRSPSPEKFQKKCFRPTSTGVGGGKDPKHARMCLFGWGLVSSTSLNISDGPPIRPLQTVRGVREGWVLPAVACRGHMPHSLCPMPQEGHALCQFGSWTSDFRKGSEIRATVGVRTCCLWLPLLSPCPSPNIAKGYQKGQPPLEAYGAPAGLLLTGPLLENPCQRWLQERITK